MTSTATSDVDRVSRAVWEVVRHACDLVDKVAATVESALARRVPPRRADLADLEQLLSPVLADLDRPTQGAGFVAAVGLLEDAPWWLEWFARDAEGRVQRLVTHSDPQGIGFYDYEALPWYVVPRSTGKRHVTGPYVDYLCTEEYTLTFSAPVLVDGRFAGVAGADIAVKRVEAHLLPALCASDVRLAVVHDDRRILASNSGRHLCGDLLSADAGATGSPAHRIHDLPLSVVQLVD